MIISGTIMGQENQWAKYFNPKRFIPIASAPKFIEEGIDVAVNLVKKLFVLRGGRRIKRN